MSKAKLESSEDIAKLRSELSKKALSIITEALPNKCEHLTKLLDSDPLFHMDKVTQVRASTTFQSTATEPNKKRKIDNASSLQVTSVVVNDAQIPSNTVITSVLEKLKPELLQFIDSLNAIKIWIHLNIPRIEDGNNFGVSVQEEALNEIGRAEEASFNALDTITKYFVTRAKLVCKQMKYPGVEDYAESVYSLDEKAYVDLRLATKDLRNNHAILYDMIQKNLEKIVKPRSTHTNTMF